MGRGSGSSSVAFIFLLMRGISRRSNTGAAAGQQSEMTVIVESHSQYSEVFRKRWFGSPVPRTMLTVMAKRNIDSAKTVAFSQRSN